MLAEYGEGLKIKEKGMGNHRRCWWRTNEPVVENNTDATVYYKPQGPPLDYRQRDWTGSQSRKKCK